MLVNHILNFFNKFYNDLTRRVCWDSDTNLAALLLRFPPEHNDKKFDLDPDCNLVPLYQ